jgi:hypothetical protein
MITETEILDKLYLDWFNNFLTVNHFAEYHYLTMTQACDIIERGRMINHGKHLTHDLKFCFN